MKNKVVLFFVATLVVFIFLRLWNLPQAIQFSSDEGRDFLTVWNMYVNNNIVFIGPPSQYAIDGRQFFFGPAPYYLILPALLFGNWEPLSVSYFMVGLNAAVFLFSLLILQKLVRQKRIIYFYALLCTFMPSVVVYTQSYWNPHFMFPTSMLLVVLLVWGSQKKEVRGWLFVLVGFLFGLGFQFHYSFIFAILVSLVWLFREKQLYKKSVVFIVSGFLIGFFPLIAYDVTHNFYNLQTFFLVFTHNNQLDTGFRFNTFYFISLIPFLFFFLAKWLAVFEKKQFGITAILVISFVVWSIFKIGAVNPPLLDYTTLQTISLIIREDKPTEFNIVDQFTRDNRAMALRYLLTVEGVEPLGVEEYKKAKTLYIYSGKSLEEILADPVWEVSSAQPLQRVYTWQIRDDLILYKLQK